MFTKTQFDSIVLNFHKSFIFSFRPLVNWLAAEGLGVVLGDIRRARQVDMKTIDKYRQVDK